MNPAEPFLLIELSGRDALEFAAMAWPKTPEALAKELIREAINRDLLRKSRAARRRRLRGQPAHANPA